jgi:hypothetical protein
VTFREANIRRLERGITQCLEVLDVPRRLGADATDKELADDKRTARRVKHRLVVALSDWNGTVDGNSEGAPPDGTGARLLWSQWWDDWQEQATELRQQADNRDEQHSIDRELEGISHVMAELRS